MNPGVSDHHIVSTIEIIRLEHGHDHAMRGKHEHSNW